MPASEQTVLALRCRGLRKIYRGTTALDDVAFDVPPGIVFGLAGINGAGKTTLIKCLLDFCAIQAGAIEIFGVPHTHTAGRSQLAFLPERFTPPHYLTGGDFLRYMSGLHGRVPQRLDIEEICDELELDRAALSKPVRNLSKGMTQKLGLAACFLSGKALLILDEPTSGLDPKARALFKARLKRMQGHSIFLTSHALADMDELCEYMAVMHEGRLRFIGTPAQLRSNHGATTLEQAFLACIAGCIS